MTSFYFFLNDKSCIMMWILIDTGYQCFQGEKHDKVVTEMMRYMIQFQINIFALMILFALAMIIKEKSKVENYSKMLLKWIMIASGIAIIAEPLTWIFDGQLFLGAYFLEYSTNVVLFMMGPILGGLMLCYVDYTIFRESLRIQNRRYYMHMAMVTFIVLIINFFYPVYFSINTVTNNFSSGSFKWVHYVVLGCIYLYMIFFVLKNRRKTDAFVVRIFILFFALPIMGMLVQLIDSKLHFSWTSIVLAILIVYVFLESTSTEFDYLTKLFNRQSYEHYVRHLIEIKKPFALMLIDLNDFKTINDTYGHQKGDQVLISFSKVLKRVFPVEAMVCRLGGDEFMVVVEKNQPTIEWELSEIDRILKKHDDAFLHTLKFSYGYQTYDSNQNFDALYTIVDQKMYFNKKVHKQTINQIGGLDEN